MEQLTELFGQLKVEKKKKTNASNQPQLPEEIGYFTKLLDGTIVKDSRDGLRELSLKGVVHKDLTEGLRNFVPQTKDEIYSLDDVLSVVDKPDLLSVLSQRRSLARIMKLPFEPHTSFHVVYYKHYIFIVCNDVLGVDIDRRLQYSGFKFEELATTARSASDPQARFYSVLRQRLPGATVYYTAEVDAIDIHDDYVELKTHAKVLSHLSLQRKLLSTWCQVYLGATDKIVMGYRSKTFRVANVQRMSERDIYQSFQKMPLMDKLGAKITPQTLTKFYAEAMAYIVKAHKGGAKPKQFEFKYHPSEPRAKQFSLEPMALTVNISMYKA